ncbi:M16 family metallopeptidase [Shewanella intestini]|uniref:Insulinase family protein n=1 Tax=Shewanella intestini TaxID=2017544 RepID=A0ABS5I1U9_9GAMM|nr:MULTISPECIES: M16 family metallopeptidase [Shewanella]MBR9727390.1 insulinase family protein [Shewanella intestini]MRG35560.1 hypothetical protein [Shewanella sp. XMDDZSB0408]
MKKTPLVILMSSLMFTGCSTQTLLGQTSATEQATQQVAAKNVLAERPGIEHGMLANGMKYMFVKNTQSGERVSLQLIVHSGSLDEDDDQQGIAHLVEHMAFNGTTDFPHNKIIEHQESLGLVFGRDVNAMTEFNITSYFLHLSNNTDSMLDEAFHMLSQQASAVVFDNDELDKERPVVEEEWRGGRTLMGRLGQANRMLLLKGSRYGERNPIGDMDLVRHVDASRIKAFWETWYHPNNMTMLVVGDTDKASVEAKLNKYFADLPKVELPKRADTALPLPKEMALSILQDPEVTTEVASISLRAKQAIVTDEATLRQDILNQMAMMMFSQRMNEKYQVESPQISRIAASSQPLMPGYNNNRILAVLQNQHYQQAYQELFDNLSAYGAHGFKQADLTMAASNVLMRYKKVADGQQNATNSRLMSAIFSQVRLLQPLTDPAARATAAEKVLATITLKDVNEHFRDMLKTRSPIVTLQINPKHIDQVPTSAEIKQWWSTAMANPSRVDNTSAEVAPLFSKAPVAAKVLSHQHIAGTHIWKFANGASVWFTPSDETKNQLLVKWQGLGGTQALPLNLQRAGQLSARTMGEFGYGGLNSIELTQINAGQELRQMPFISAQEHGVSGRTDLASLEHWLQNLNKRITAPQVDATLWQSRKQSLERGVFHRSTSPNGMFNQAIDKLRYKNDPMSQPITKDEIAAIKADDLLQAWEQLFSNAADHQLVIVGPATPEQVIDLASRYIGNLPKGKSLTPTVLPKLNDGQHKVRIEVGTEPVAVSTQLFNVDFPYSEDAENQAELLSRMLSVRLREKLREESGGVYSLRFGIRLDKERQQAFGMLSYSHEPVRGDELKEQADKVIATFLKNGVTDAELEQLKKQQRLAYAEEAISDRNRFAWASHAAMTNNVIDERTSYLNWLSLVTTSEINALGHAILSKPNTIDARLLPEKS